ncbi:hypothetical protein TNCV_2962041 [Trichonephila clavipes]|nr:hypothetical protein TNCV_2962041 [Trichonephila clavipes]
MITTNIDVTNRLANGAVGKLIHVETNDEGLVKTICLELPQVGEKSSSKSLNSPVSLSYLLNCLAFSSCEDVADKGNKIKTVLILFISALYKEVNGLGFSADLSEYPANR